jgi:hypothetical protein
MAISYSIDGNILEITDKESTCTDDIIQMLETAFSDPLLVPSSNILINLTQLSVWKNFKDLRRISVIFGQHREQIGPRCAIVASNAVQDSLARNFALQTEMLGVAFDVFADFDEARRWIQNQCN